MEQGRMEFDLSLADIDQAQETLLRSGSAMIAFSSIGMLCIGGDDDLGRWWMMHLLAFYLTGLAGSCLLFLSFSGHKFPSAAMRAAAVVDDLPRRLVWWMMSPGRLLLVFYSSLWCAAAMAYLVCECSFFYYGIVCCNVLLHLN
ncbi:hypothetical protein Cni_G26593 [Canna indica]|uniref:Uncharacterized protein n=1 Tax=Canna indica TaxID=4628 RepID=A0AAQ3L005_9LILI|nr:hypothetical protein Cni_G26593 [Canna indica]